MDSMRILLTNDDGFYAPGLQALRKQLKQLGDVVVVAPASEQSAAGHSVTLYSPLIVQPINETGGDFIGWAIEGRPADCVKLALLELLSDPPDLIVSGTNAGSNAGINVLYSGTVAAAIEGSFFRRTAIAISQDITKAMPPDYDVSAKYAIQVIRQILATQPIDGSLFNVNLPSLARGPVQGIKVVPQNIAPYVENFDKRVDPRGRTYFWIGSDFGCPDPHPDTDEPALKEGFITVTPLQFDLTRHRALAELRARDWKVEQV
jgi:5'-nucleotidase